MGFAVAPDMLENRPELLLVPGLNGSVPLWSLEIMEPQRRPRSIPWVSREHPLIFGTRADADLQFRDPQMASLTGELWVDDGTVWVRIYDTGTLGRVGDLEFRELRIPSEVTFRVGGTELCLVPYVPPGVLIEDSLKEEPEFLSHYRPWLTWSESGKVLLKSIQRAATTRLSIYLWGETGTGKDVLAELIHAYSPRSEGPFVAINCGALPMSLAESELFGHVKGAFTGAVQNRAGALMQAHQGTLFLDEVADLPLEIQVKLLRFLENGELRPVGSDRIVHSDVRIVCATHQPLEKLVAEGRFRKDLYFRLASAVIHVPPLRERQKDVMMLAKRFASEHGARLSLDVLAILKRQPWPGNVRELRHAIERAAANSNHPVKFLEERDFDFLETTQEDLPEILGLTRSDGTIATFAETERALVLRAIRLARGNRTEAARLIGVARSTFFSMLKRHGVEPVFRKSRAC